MKAFNRVRHEDIEMLEKLITDGKDMRIIAIRVNNDTREYQHECALSPDLFSFVIQ